jgi:hypothetical protein
LIKELINNVSNKYVKEELMDKINKKMIEDFVWALWLITTPNENNRYFVNFKKYFKKLNGLDVMRNEIRISKGKLMYDNFYDFIIDLTKEKNFVYFITFMFYLDPIIIMYSLFRLNKNKKKREVVEEKVESRERAIMKYLCDSISKNEEKVMV